MLQVSGFFFLWLNLFQHSPGKFDNFIEIGVILWPKRAEEQLLTYLKVGAFDSQNPRGWVQPGFQQKWIWDDFWMIKWGSPRWVFEAIVVFTNPI